MEVEEKQATEFDRETFTSLAAEFGGLAGWWVKYQDGSWSQYRWDQAMVRLYGHRHKLEGVKDQEKRGNIALQAFSEGEPDTAMLDRIEARLAESFSTT